MRGDHKVFLEETLAVEFLDKADQRLRNISLRQTASGLFSTLIEP
jgi:hypothetical protein